MAADTRQYPLPPWGDALAGATGALVANAVVYPLDIVKTRIQVQVRHKSDKHEDLDTENEVYKSTYDAIQKILADQGAAGLYSGLVGSLVGVVSTNFAYFYWYSVVRTLILPRMGTDKPPTTATELSLGAVAGALAQVFTIPVSVITTRQQTSSKSSRKGLVATGKEIVDGEDGWNGLWRGLKASLILVVNPAITYGAYQRLRLLLFARKPKLRPWQAFGVYIQWFKSKLMPVVLGASAKALATIVTQPLIVAKVGLQSKPPAARQGRPFRSFGEVISYIVKHEGLAAVFKGLGPQITKGVLVQGLLMMIKDRIEILFILIFAHVNRLRNQKLQQTTRSTAYRIKNSSGVGMLSAYLKRSMR